MTQSPSLPELPKPRAQFLALAEQCGARLTGKPDGSEPIEIVFTIPAWKAFDAAHLKGYKAGSAAAAQAAWRPVATAPHGVRVLLGPREAPVVGIVKHPPEWEEERDPVCSVVHYNGNVFVAGYHCSEWMPLPAAPTQGAEGAAPQEADALREVDTPWQLLEMARRVGAAYRNDTLTIQEIHYLETMIERAEKLPTAARDVLEERRRQVSVEGWTPAHDDEHADGALAAAAGCYARLAAEAVKFNFPAPWVENIGWTDMQPDWPWGGGPKPAPLRRMLVKAGALILAEIERLDRAALAQHQPQQGEGA